MKKLRYLSITIILLISIIGISFSWSLISDNKILFIVKSKPIPFNESEFQIVSGVKTCGTLYCIGKIIKVNGVVESIEFSWKADLAFPANYCMGDIYIPLFNVGSWQGYFPVVNPYTGSAQWSDAKGEYHIWEYKIILYKNDTIIQAIADGNKEWRIRLNDIAPPDYQGIGWSNISEGKMEVYGALRSSDSIEKLGISIETDPFTLVRQGNNFYFLE